RDHVQQAIAAAREAHDEWAAWPWEDRAAGVLKAPELLPTTWRATLNAATMLGQSKTAFQAEIDAACELIDFWRFNPAYAQQLYDQQPLSDHSMWNQLDYRPLEGFVYAVTPFTFTSIAGNLPTAPALMGNTVICKPASSAMLSAYYILRLPERGGCARRRCMCSARTTSCGCSRRRVCRRASSISCRVTPRRSRRCCSIRRTWLVCISRAARRSSIRCGHASAPTSALITAPRAWLVRRAERTSSLPTRQPIRRSWRWRWRAAR